MLISHDRPTYKYTSMGLFPRLRMRRECRERFPLHRLQRKPLVSDPGMHHGTCVTHVGWRLGMMLLGVHCHFNTLTKLQQKATFIKVQGIFAGKCSQRPSGLYLVITSCFSESYAQIRCIILRHGWSKVAWIKNGCHCRKHWNLRLCSIYTKAHPCVPLSKMHAQQFMLDLDKLLPTRFYGIF